MRKCHAHLRPALLSKLIRSPEELRTILAACVRDWVEQTRSRRDVSDLREQAPDHRKSVRMYGQLAKEEESLARRSAERADQVTHEGQAAAIRRFAARIASHVAEWRGGMYRQGYIRTTNNGSVSAPHAPVESFRPVPKTLIVPATATQMYGPHMRTIPPIGHTITSGRFA